jgi:hypothetical protein
MISNKIIREIDESECLFIAEGNLTDSTPITSYDQFNEVTSALKNFKSLLKNTLTENLAVQLTYMDTEGDSLVLGTDIAEGKLIWELENQPVELLANLLAEHKIVSEDFNLQITKLDYKLTYGSKEMGYDDILKEVAYIIEDIYNKDLKEAKKLLNLNDRES